jgi:N-terminal domain of galactosyltransferase/N-terminal region of glycosyl transferase group 7
MTIKYVFIVPYRNREMHKHFFDKYMSYVLEDMRDYEIVFAHQNNTLPFNRGGMKNCGFLYIKQKYPETYKDIIFIFNDIDTVPYKKNLLNYDLSPNEIKHYFGFNFCLGGIFAIRGSDFERINGFPSLWSWGWEDTVIYERALKMGIKINREQYYDFGDSHILHFVDDLSKKVSMKNKQAYLNKQIFDGLHQLRNVNFNFNAETNMLDVNHMECSYSPNDNTEINLVLKINDNQPPKPNSNHNPNPKNFMLGRGKRTMVRIP